MRLGLELFVRDVDASIAFYTSTLGFTLVRAEPGNAIIRTSRSVLGLRRIADLPAAGRGPGFTQTRLAADRGAGVEIVLELDRVVELAALHDRCRHKGVVVEPLQRRPWGLWDFRLVDPDGYYLRLTHGDRSSIARAWPP